MRKSLGSFPLKIKNLKGERFDLFVKVPDGKPGRNAITAPADPKSNFRSGADLIAVKNAPPAAIFKPENFDPCSTFGVFNLRKFHC